MWRRFWGSLGAKARSLGRVIRREIRQTETKERDRAHMATLGDRPFPGCRPCEPALPGEPSTATSNPAASPRQP